MIRKQTVSFFLIISFLACSIILQYKHLVYAGNGANSDYTLGLKPAKPELWEDWAYVDGQPAADMVYSSSTVFELLQDKKYLELDEYFNRLNKLYLAGKLDEWWFMEATNLADLDAEAGLNEVEKWVKATDSAYAYQTKATLLQDIAWKMRGGGYYQDVTLVGGMGFNYYLHQSLEPIMAALARNPKLPQSYKALFSLSEGVSEFSSKLNEWNTLMETHLPQAFYPRMKVLDQLTPKWGGSYTKMREYALESQKFYDINPRLRYLLSYEWYEKGRFLEKNKKYEKAIEAYSKAIFHSAHTPWLDRRGLTYWKIQDYQKAKVDFETSLKVIPDGELPMKYLAKSYYKLGLKDLSKKMQQKYIDSYPQDHNGWSYRGFQEYEASNYSEAATYFKQAIKLKEKSTYDTYMYAASLYEIHHQDEKQALLAFVALCKREKCDDLRLKNINNAIKKRGFIE